jgi:hypothetical protein
MKTLWIGAAAVALWSGAALAQGLPNAAPGSASITTEPAPSVSVTTTQKTRDANGVQTEKVDTYDRGQSFSSGDGALSAKTTTETTQHSAVTVPTVTTRRTTTTTTSETTR